MSLGRKTCTGCHKVKALEEFSPHTRGVDGRHPRCKTCRAAARRVMRKVCGRCRASVNVARFARHAGRGDGLQKWCNDCRAEHEGRTVSGVPVARRPRVSAFDLQRAYVKRQDEKRQARVLAAHGEAE